MSDKIVSLPGCTAAREMPDFSPAFGEKWASFANELSEVIDKWIGEGIPPQFVIGQLECCKADVLDAMLGYSED